VNRFRSFMPTALRIVRMARAVRPWRADYFPEVTLVDAQLEHGNLLAFDRTDMNLIGVVHQCFCDCFY
jgi:hypothetical protein